MSLAIRAGLCSLIGRRSENEDAVAVHEFPELTVWLVADGMGGQEAGRAASQLGMEVVARELAKPARDAAGAQDISDAIRPAFRRANQEVLELHQALPRAGSSLVLGLRFGGEDRLLIASLGDCRAYHFRDLQVRRLTDDHDLRTALLQAGRITEEQARHSRIRNVLWKFLGADDPGMDEPDLTTLPIQGGDWVLLSTDGVYGFITHEQMRETIRSAGDVQRAAGALCGLALDQGGRDNASCVVLAVSG